MRIALDEGVPRQLATALRDLGFDASGFDPNWKGMSNGRLIAVVEAAGFDILVTNDKNMSNQQSLRGRALAVVALPTNRRSVIIARVEDIADTLRRAGAGQHVVIETTGFRVARSAGPNGESRETTFPNVRPFLW